MNKNHELLNAKLSAEEDTTIGIIHEHAMFRNGLVNFLNNSGFPVIIQSCNAKEFIEKLGEHLTPSIVLIDLDIPQINTIETLSWIQRNHPDIKILALFNYSTGNFVIRVMQNGADGCIPKDCEPQELIAAINQIKRGELYYNEKCKGKRIKNAEFIIFKAIESLTEREKSILKMISTDLTYKEIAAQLHLSPRTVEGYVIELCEKFDIRTRIGLVLFAIRNRIIQI